MIIVGLDAGASMAGMAAIGSAPVIRQCGFIENEAVSRYVTGGGGGIYGDGASIFTVEECSFVATASAPDGAARAGARQLGPGCPRHLHFAGNIADAFGMTS